MASLLLAVIGIWLIVWGLRLNGLPIFTTIWLFGGCIFLVSAAVSLNTPDGFDGCFVDWDARTNSEVCD